MREAITKVGGDVHVIKVDEQLGLVLGYALVTKINGEDYFDEDVISDNIDEGRLVKDALDFVENAAISVDNHARDDDGNPIPDGSVPFVFPLTEEIAKALDIQARRYGLLIGMRPSAETFELFRKGERRQFSIAADQLVEEFID